MVRKRLAVVASMIGGAIALALGGTSSSDAFAGAVDTSAAPTAGLRHRSHAGQRHPHDHQRRPESQLHPADSGRLRQQSSVPAGLRFSLERRHRR